MGLFGRSKSASSSSKNDTGGVFKGSADEQLRLWRRELRGYGMSLEIRRLERDIRKIQMEENKVVRSCKDLAKKGQTQAVKILAKELVRTRRQRDRLYGTRAQLHSVANQLQTQIATAKMAGSMQKSARVMSAMNKMIKLPEVAQIARKLSKEMAHAGLIEEMMEDTMEAAFGDSDEEEMAEAAESEVNAIIEQVLTGQLQPSSTLGLKAIPTKAPEAEEEEDDEEETDALRDRLEQLKT